MARSPNSSLGGDLRKAWIVRDGKRFLLKAGSAPFLQEPYGEVIATELLSRLLQPGQYVPYDLVEYRGDMLSRCTCMVTRDECFVPAWELINPVKHRGSVSNWQLLVSRYEGLGLMEDLSWFDARRLEGFPSFVERTLAGNRNLGTRRAAIVAKKVAEDITTVSAIAAR